MRGAQSSIPPAVAAPFPATSPPLGARAGRIWRQHWLDVAMVLPLVLYILGFTLVPVLQSILLGFTPRTGGAALTLANYEALLSRPDFGLAVVNTVGITLIGVTLELVVGLAIALMLAHIFPLRGLF